MRLKRSFKMSYYGSGNSGGGFLERIPVVTRNIVLINVIFFIATLVNEEFMMRTFALFSPLSPLFRPWQLVTHMFMHGGFWHIFLNMYTLLMFGTVLERHIGAKKFLVFYFVTGLGAALLHTGVEWARLISSALPVAQPYLNIPCVGASGAIYGVLIGYGLLFPEAVLMLLFPPIPLKAKWLVVIFVVTELLTGIFGTTDGIAHFAHLGGMLFGWLLLRYWRKSGRLYRRDRWF